MPVPVHPAKTALSASGLTQADAARRLGLSVGVLRNVLNGHARSWPRLRRDLAELLGRPEQELFPVAAVGEVA